MAEFRPRFITFDCYGTLTHFQMTSLTRTLFAGRVSPDRMQAFTTRLQRVSARRGAR